MNDRFKEETIIKGKDLKGYILCKVLSENMDMRGFQYKIGMNEDINSLVMEGSCKAGLHFCILKNIVYFLSYGNKLAILTVPDEEEVYVDNGKFRTHRLDIRKIMSFSETAAWEYLHKNCVDITAGRNYAVRSVAANGSAEMVKYLHENGADITAQNNYAIRAAAKNGNLEAVKYLHENGADITAQDSYAIKIAAGNGHLETVKYLYEKGTDIRANQEALGWAAENGHLEIVKYLHKNGTSILAANTKNLLWTEANGHQEVGLYLKKNME